MGRRVFPREFKVEAVRLIRERGVSVAQAARDLEIHENMLRRWAKELNVDPMQAFPGHGQEKPEQLEIERLRKENAKLRAERDILKRQQRSLRGKRDEVCFHRAASACLAGVLALLGVGRRALRLPRLASSRTKRPRGSGRRANRKDSLELRGERSHLWRPPRLAGRARRRPLLRPAQGRALDADERPARSPTTSAASKRRWRKIAVRRSQPSRSAIRR